MHLNEHMNGFLFIELHQLQEPRRSGPKYIWTNKQKNPSMVTLDRILVSIEWRISFHSTLHGAKPGLVLTIGQFSWTLGKAQKTGKCTFILKRNGFWMKGLKKGFRTTGTTTKANILIKDTP
jgi:hypothetical protein